MFSGDHLERLLILSLIKRRAPTHPLAHLQMDQMGMKARCSGW